MKALYWLLVGATLLACASVQPAKIEQGDRCLRCRRPISDLRLAGEVIDTMRAPFPFRTAGCLAKYIKANSGTPFAAVFVTDYKTGKMIQASDAWFAAVNIPVPESHGVESDYYAFRTQADAREFQADTSKLLRWPQVVAAAN